MIAEYRTFLNPKKIYLPLTDNDSKVSNLSVEEGDRVLVGQVVSYKINEKTKTPILSTISGTVVGFEDKTDRYSKIVKHIVIENDLLNESTESINLKVKAAQNRPRNFPKNVTTYKNNLSAAQVRNQLTSLGIDKVAVDGLYTDISFSGAIKHVVLNAVFTNEPFISTDYELIIHNR